jgi:hypothetical protein
LTPIQAPTEADLSTDEAVAPRPAPLTAADPRAMLPIEEVATLLDVSVRTLKRQHEADPGGYPAERIGGLWRIPRWWVERKVACGTPAT